MAQPEVTPESVEAELPAIKERYRLTSIALEQTLRHKYIVSITINPQGETKERNLKDPAWKAVEAQTTQVHGSIDNLDSLFDEYDEHKHSIETTCSNFQEVFDQRRAKYQDDADELEHLTWQQQRMNEATRFIQQKDMVMNILRNELSTIEKDWKEADDLLRQENDLTVDDFAQIFADIEENVNSLKAQLEPIVQEVKDKSLRIEFAVGTHVSASEYGRRKHVSGRTNAERQDNASRAGQYFAEFNGQSVTDNTIRQWEREALQHGTIEKHGGAYHVFHTFDHPVGYASPSRSETNSIRAEYSARHIHSHPRE